MRYEVYGIYNTEGTNYQVGVKPTQAAAIRLTEKVAPTCKFWAILVKSRKFSYPSEIISGFRGGPPLRATMLMMPNPKYGNPILCQDDAKRFWETFK